MKILTVIGTRPHCIHVGLFYRELAYPPTRFSGLDIPPAQFGLVTIQRAENNDDPNVLAGITKSLSGARSPIILPLQSRAGIATVKIAHNLSGQHHDG